jgi:hypothetical protein
MARVFKGIGSFWFPPNQSVRGIIELPANIKTNTAGNEDYDIQICIGYYHEVAYQNLNIVIKNVPKISLDLKHLNSLLPSFMSVDTEKIYYNQLSNPIKQRYYEILFELLKEKNETNKVSEQE